MLQTYWNDVMGWFKHPYNEDGNVIDWFLFFGLVIVINILWLSVIRRLLDKA